MKEVKTHMVLAIENHSSQSNIVVVIAREITQPGQIWVIVKIAHLKTEEIVNQKLTMLIQRPIVLVTKIKSI